MRVYVDYFPYVCHVLSLQVVFRLGIALLSDFSWFPNEVVYTSGFVLCTLSVGCEFV